MASRANSSVLWDYFVRNNVTKKAKCLICGELYSYKSSTGNLKSHLRVKHLSIYQRVASAQAPNHLQLAPPPLTALNQSAQLSGDASTSAPQPSTNGNQLFPEPAESGQVSSEQALPPLLPSASQALPTPTRNVQQQSMERYSTAKKISTTLKAKIDKDLMDLFIDSYHPFSLVEERGFLKFCRNIPGYVLPSRKTVSQKMLPALYESTKASVTEKLKQSVSSSEVQKICLTSDLWTSRANESYIAVTGHYINDSFELKSILISCQNFEGSHTSENISAALLEMANEWNLTGKINFVVTDNAANIQRSLTDLRWKHYGCYAHTLNLIVQDAIKNVETNITKLKKIVRHFKTSSSALEKLLKAQTRENPTTVPKRLIQEVPTRWNSCFYMMNRCVELEQYIRATVAILRAELPVISNEEWQLFAELAKILKPFDDVTNCMSGESYMTGSLVIVMTRCLITSCEKLLNESFSEVALRVVRQLKNGLELRFANVEKSATFSTCTFLDPRYKLSVFTDPADARQTRAKVQDMLAALIAAEGPSENTAVDDPRTPGPSSQLDQFSPWAILQNIVGTQRPAGTPLSRAIKEIDTYLNDDSLPVFGKDGSFNCPLEWWRNHKFAYPNLARLFKQYGNIMATSVPCERIFSKTGIIVSDRRTRLTSEKVSQISFLNVNLDPARFKV